MFEQFNFIHLGRSLFYFWTVHFQSSKFLDRTLWPFLTTLVLRFIRTSFELKDLSLRPMIFHFGSKNRTLSSWVVHFGSNDRPVWLKTVDFDGPFTFARPSCLRSIHFQAFGPSTLDLTQNFDRPETVKRIILVE